MTEGHTERLEAAVLAGKRFILVTNWFEELKQRMGN